MIALAMVLDALFGEPDAVWRRVPHPAVVMGKTVAALDSYLNNRSRRNGIVALAILIVLAGVFGLLVSAFLGALGVIILGAILLAQRSLVDHVNDVAVALRKSPADGREAVARIVGRDVGEMNEPDIARAAIESAAENFSDGVIAPLFWLCVGGLPGIMIYKAVNTADSMIGYRTPKYTNFGWAAARLDDALNWFPARITGGLIWVAGGFYGAWAQIRREAGQHRSPNAGWPEAAMAPALGVALSGPRSYEGRMQDFQWVNAAGHQDVGAKQIEAATKLLWRSWAIAFAAVIVMELLRFLWWTGVSVLTH